jgi:hypothetical protein
MFKQLIEAFKVKKRPAILGFLEGFLCIVIGNSLGVFIATFHFFSSNWIWIGRICSSILFIAVARKIFILTEDEEKVPQKYKLIFGAMLILWSIFINLSP